MKWIPFLLFLVIVSGSIPLQGTLAGGPRGVPTLGERPDGWWLHFYRDSNANGIDDLLDRAFLNGSGTFDIVFADLDHLPTPRDVGWLRAHGIGILYAARHLPTIAVGPLDVRDLPTLASMDGLVLLEVPPDMHFMLQYSVPSMKVRESSEYSPYTARDLGYDGTGVNIAIMDSGVNDQIPTGHSMVDDMDDDPTTYDPKHIAGCDASTGVIVGGAAVNPEASDSLHGTHVAGDALGTGDQYQGAAPGSRLIDIRVGSLMNLNMVGVLGAMDWCIENNETDWENDGPRNNGVPIASMSFGGTKTNGADTMSQSLNSMVEHGIVCVVAAGNDGPNNNGLSTPGSADRSICVASYDDHDTIDRGDDTISGFSARGPRADDGDSDPYDEMKPHIAAPGTGITSALAWSGYLLASTDGTSMATPQVSGVIALMLEANPDLRPHAPDYEKPIKRILADTAQDRDGTDRPQYSQKWDRAWGYGQIDAYGAVKRAEDLTRTAVDAPDEVDAGTRKVHFEATLPVTRTPYTIEDDVTRFTITLPDDWGRPSGLTISATGGVGYTTAVTDPQRSGGLWTVGASLTHTEDIDRYQECLVTVGFDARAPSVDVPTNYDLVVRAWTNDVPASRVKHTVTVQPVPNLVYEDHAIDDDDMGSSDGNGDGVVNPGETIECKVQIRNIGTRTAPNVVGIISTDSPYVTLNDDTETYGNIAAGQTAWTLGDYDFEVSSSAPVGENITFDLTLTDSLGHEWNDTFNIQVGGTEHDIAVTDIDLPPRAEVGDTVTVTGTVENMGLDDEQDVEIRMVVNGSVEDTAYIDLASGASADVALEWSPDEAGTYEIWVNATPVPGEDAVNNNGLNASITVYADRGKVFVDDVHGDVSGYDDLLDALSDEGYDPVNASDAGTELTAMLRARWVLLPAPNTLPEDAMEVLRDYVRLGGGLLMLADADPDGYSRMTGPMGINWSFSPGKYDDTTSDIGDHAVTDDVDTVYLRSPAASLDLDGGTALVTSSNGAIVAAAVEYGEGRAVLISDDDLLGDDSLSREDNLRLGMNAATWLEWSVVEDDVGIALLDAPEIAPPNTTIDVELAVINLGTANATDIEVRLTHGDDVTTRSVASLSPGEWANLTIGIEFDSFGRYRLATSTGATDDAPSNEGTWKAIDIFEGNGTIGIYTWEGNRSDHGRFFSTLIHLGFSTEEIDTEIRYEDIAGLDSVYLIDPGNLEDEEIAAIQDFVRSGKGLLLVSDDPDAANLIADALGIRWASWPGREGATDRIARYHFTEHVGSLYLSRPYAHVSGPFLFADYANDTLQGSNITFGEGRAIGTSDIGLFANDTLDREDNARFARQLARYLHRAPADVDGAIVNLSFRPFVERDETSEVTATVHNLGSDTGEFDVVLEFDGDEVNRTTVELDASEHVPVTLGFVPDLNGTFNLSMYVEPPSGDMRTANDRLNGTISVLRVMLDDPCEEDTGWEEESLWHISGRRYRSGHRSWWYGNESTGDYSGGSGDASLRRSFTLVSVRDAVLTFRYYVDLDDGDRAEVNLSSDGGSNWTTLMTLTGLAGRWDSATIDLGDHEGEDVIIAFHVTHNGSGSGEGVFLEDIRVAGFANLSQVLEILSPVGDDYVAGQWGVRAHARDTDGIENVSWSLDNGSWEEMTLQEGSEGDGVWNATFNSTTVADGDHRITVRSTNSTGYIREAVVDFVVDNTPPLVDITSPDEGTIGGEVWINATADDATSGIEGLDLRIDDGDWTGTDGSTLWNSTGVSDGDHAIEVRARDRAGNRATDTVNVTVDNTPPDISVSSPSEGEEVKGRVNITVRITDATGVDRVEYRIDDGTWYGLNLTSGDDRDGVWKTSWNSTEVAEGDHDITVRAIDDLGNRGNELVSVYVNNLDDPPTIEIVEPEDGSLVRQVVSLTVNATDDESVEAVRYRVDDGDWIDLTRNDEYWTGQWDCRGVADGDHTLHFIAIDASDQNATTEVNLTVDNTAPEIEPLGPTGYVKEVIKIRVRVRDEHLRDVVYRVDDDEWLYLQYRDDVHFGYVNTSAYPDGNHTLEVRADDEVDNVNSTSWEVTFDNTWPTVNITGPSDDEVVRGTVNITGFFEEDHPVSVEYRVGDKAWKEITTDGSTFNVTWDSTTVGDGEASIYVRCTDRAGNIGYDSVDVTVDNVDEAPDISVLEPAGGLHGTEVHVRVRVTDDRGIDTVEFRPEDGDWAAMSTGANDTYVLTWNSTGYDGNVDIYIRATDTGGNIDQVVSTVDLDTVSPEFRGLRPRNATVFEDTINITVEVSDEHLSTVSIDTGSGWTGMEESGGVYYHEWSPGEDGWYHVRIRATDSVDNVGRTDVWYCLDTTPPIVILDLPQGVQSGHVRIGADVGDETLDTVEYSVDDNGWYPMTLEGGTTWSVRWDSSTVGDGSHTVAVRAIDRAGHRTQRTGGITTNNENDPPEITITSPTGGQYTDIVMVRAKVLDDFGVDTVEVSADGTTWIAMERASPKMKDVWTQDIDTAQYPDGTLILHVRGTDINGTMNESSVAIETDNSPPEIRITAPKRGSVVSGDVTLRARVTDPNIATVEADLGSGWTLMTLSNDVWSIVWDSTAEVDGPYNLSVRAVDIFGHDAISLVSVEIDNVNMPPDVEIEVPTSGRVSGTLEVVATAGDDRGIATVTYTLGNLTGDMDDEGSGIYRAYIATELLDDGQYILRVRATDTDGLTRSATISVEVDNVEDPVYIVALDTEGRNSDRSRDEMTFEVRVTNEGNVRTTIALSVEHEPGIDVFLDRTEVTLDPDDYEVIVVKVVPREPGMYTITVIADDHGRTDDVDISVVVPTEGASEDVTGTWLAAGLGLAIIALVGIAWYRGWLPWKGPSVKR